MLVLENGTGSFEFFESDITKDAVRRAIEHTATAVVRCGIALIDRYRGERREIFESGWQERNGRNTPLDKSKQRYFK